MNMKKFASVAISAYLAGMFYEQGRRHGQAIRLGPDDIRDAIVGIRKHVLDLAAKISQGDNA